MTVSLADRGRYWCSVDTGGAAGGETQGDNLEYSLKLEVSSLLNMTEYFKISHQYMFIGTNVLTEKL